MSLFPEKTVRTAFLLAVLLFLAAWVSIANAQVTKSGMSGSAPQKGSIKLDLQVDEDSSVFTKTVMVELKTLDASEVEPFVRKSLSKYGSVSVNSQANSLVITDREPKLSDLVNFVSEMDKLGMTDFVHLQTEVIKLTNVKASLLLNVVSNRLTADGSVQADDTLNVLIVTDVKGKIDYVKQIIGQLDRPPQQILIEAKIVELFDNDFSDVGIDIAGLLNQGSVYYSTSRTNSNQDTTYSSGERYKSISSNEGKNQSLDLYPDQIIDVLVGTGRAKLQASPYIVTVNNKRGTFSREAVNTISSYSYYTSRDYTLSATPSIGEGNLITIDLEVTAEELETPEVLKTSNSAAPATSPKRTLTSTIVIREGETFVVGGFDSEYDYFIKRKTPLLGSVPILKEVFTKKTKLKSVSRVLLFITPKIIKEQKNPPTEEQKKM